MSRFPASRQSTPDGSRRAARHRILYIDQDATHAASMRQLVGSEGIELITASAGELGIRLARSCRPDLIVLELGLPGTSVTESITPLLVSSETNRIPILALSTWSCAKVPGLAMYCRRPLDVPAFLAMLRALLGARPSVQSEPPQSAPEPPPASRRRAREAHSRPAERADRAVQAWHAAAPISGVR